MTVIGRFNDTVRVAVRDGQWHSKDKEIESILRKTIPESGVSGSSPDPDKTLWDIAAEDYPLKITKHEQPEYVPGRIY